MNYMNVLSDFEIRLNRCFPATDEQVQIAKLDSLLIEKDKIIEQQAAELEKLAAKPKPRRRAAVKKVKVTVAKEQAEINDEGTETKIPVKRTARTKTRSTSKTASSKSVRTRKSIKK